MVHWQKRVDPRDARVMEGRSLNHRPKLRKKQVRVPRLVLLNHLFLSTCRHSLRATTLQPATRKSLESPSHLERESDRLGRTLHRQPGGLARSALLVSSARVRSRRLRTSATRGELSVHVKARARAGHGVGGGVDAELLLQMRLRMASLTSEPKAREWAYAGRKGKEVQKAAMG
eukprot:1426744-Pleurochrysis_carterae.AAC.1